MMSNHRSYPAYRPSGVPWLGDVPRHWKTARLKGHAANVVDLTRETGDDDIHLALEHVESWTGRFAPASNGVGLDSQVKRFRVGDVLFGKLRPYLAKVTCPNQEGVCVGEFLVLRPSITNLSPRYLEPRLLRSRPVIDAIDASTFGAKMPRADWQFIGDMPIPLPPLPEQRSIVRYLDYVDQRIRRYVSAKRKLIALLEEDKQTIVNRAVTRGLDPNVRLKASGVEWLGDLPEHWEVWRTKTVLRERSQKGFPYEPLLAATQTKGVVRKEQYESRTVLALKDLHLLKLVRVGDFVISLRSFQGGIEYAREQGIISPAYTILYPRNPAVHAYLASLFKSRPYIENLTLHVTGIRQGQNIDYSELSRSYLPLPPLSEQRAIVRYLDKATAAIDSSIARTRRQIELLQEYRTRLIADVVTGKLDVREAASQLPDEDSEAEPIGENGPLADGQPGDLYSIDESVEDSVMEEEVTACRTGASARR